MDNSLNYAKRGSNKLRWTVTVRGMTYSRYSVQPPSKYKKTIVLITPLMKFGGAVVLALLESSKPETRIVVVTQNFRDVEMIRAQLPWYLRDRLFGRGCEFHLPSSIRMTTLWLRVMLDRMNIVIHLEPQWETSLVTCGCRKALLCANSCSIELFHKYLLYYFGSSVQYVQVQYPFTEEISNVLRRVFDECDM